MITSKSRIAQYLEMTPQNLGKTYFNNDPKKEKMGQALDRGTYLAENNIKDEELVFMVEFMKQHRKYIISLL